YSYHPPHQLATDLIIEVDERGIYSGQALRMLSREPYEGCAFPVVRRVTFGIVLGNNIRAKPSVAAANIAAFVQRVNEMAPKVKCFILSPESSR
ncbi:hypothetical protein GGI18_005014, partial [Coemansia linderi]